MTLKVRLKPTVEQALQFVDVTVMYRDACNIVSQWYFDHHFKMSRKDFNKHLYHQLRSQFPELNSAMVQSTYRTVIARYKTVETQLKNKPMYIPSGKFKSKNCRVN